MVKSSKFLLVLSMFFYIFDVYAVFPSVERIQNFIMSGEMGKTTEKHGVSVVHSPKSIVNIDGIRYYIEIKKPVVLKENPNYKIELNPKYYDDLNVFYFGKDVAPDAIEPSVTFKASIRKGKYQLLITLAHTLDGEKQEAGTVGRMIILQEASKEAEKLIDDENALIHQLESITLDELDDEREQQVHKKRREGSIE